MSMPTPIALTECPGLIDLMLTGDEHGPSFTLRDVQCSVERIEDRACFEAVTPTFGLMVIFAGWYAGEHGMPVHIIVVGYTRACMKWLLFDARIGHRFNNSSRQR